MNKTSRDAVVDHSEWDAFSKIDVFARDANPETGAEPTAALDSAADPPTLWSNATD